jgi:hypothetical protein
MGLKWAESVGGPKVAQWDRPSWPGGLKSTEPPWTCPGSLEGGDGSRGLRWARSPSKAHHRPLVPFG